MSGGLSHRDTHVMGNLNKDDEQVRLGENGPSPDSVSTLLPMLIGGLVLIVVGMIAVSMFV